MSKVNVTLAKRVVAAGAAFAGVLALCASAGAAPVSPFREVAVVNDVREVQSDGVRFAWGQPVDYWYAPSVRVFDTLRHRTFLLEAPRPDCSFGSIGGGLAVWHCRSPRTLLLTDLSTGRSRKAAGIDRVAQKLPEGFFCRALSIGRHWLGFHCGNGFGWDGDPDYLNYRTGRVDRPDPYLPDSPFIDLDDIDLVRPYCAPLRRPRDGTYAPPYFDYAPPFALHAPLGAGPYGPHGTRIGSIQLGRCGTERAEILSRCRSTACRTPQLGSEYVTWGERKRAYAYLPRTRQRVLVGRAPADFLRGRKFSVAHTCNRIFARWGNTIYAARFEPGRGAPPCQHRG